jgi:hypothetical protein
MTILRTAVKVLALLTFSGLAAACSGSNEQPPDTVGVVPIVSDAGTLLPVLPDTLPPDNTATIPPDTIFGGNPCAALEEADVRSVTFAGSGRGTLTSFSLLAEDTCGYEVRAGGNDYQIIVQVVSNDQFDHPVTTAQEIDRFSDLGEEAIGVARGDDHYEVLVRVPNGFFGVTTPDEASARALAAKAVERA